MAETVNIQKMAELASAEIFSVFGWERRPLMNVNWECVEKEKHRKQRGTTTHPSDAVFKYVDPYSGEDIYVNSDLKSFAKSTLDSTDFIKTLRSLAHATECANKSLEWKGLYVDQTRNHDVVGMLFVYNHDGGYDKDFDSVVETLPMPRIELANGVFVTVVGPKKVIYLNSIAKEIKSLNSDGLVPGRADRWFFFPHLKRKVAIHQESTCCPVTALLSSLIVLGYEFPDDAERPGGEAGNTWHRKGFYAFYDGPGASIEEFKYLIDYFFMYQLEHGRAHICINMLFCEQAASATFELAKQEFARDHWAIVGKNRVEEFDKLVSNISFRRIQSVVQRFSEIDLGMVRE